jgi:UDP-N-acetyl-D-mannosaminuronate dehydrogenase
METIKYCEFAKMNSGTIREINIAVSKEAFMISEKVENDQNWCYCNGIDELG